MSKRLGWIGAQDTANKAHDLLGALIPPERKYPLHINLIRLGREICTARVPHCEICPLTDLCAYYQGVKTSGERVLPLTPNVAHRA